VICAPGNGGIVRDARCFPISPLDFASLSELVRKEQIDLVLVGPEAPLAAGLADHFAAEGTRVLGPCKDAARLESSKVFAKEFMARHGIPTAHFSIHRDPREALAVLDSRETRYPVVVKADGLAGGKGVVVARTAEEARDAVRRIMIEREFGKAGEQIVLEEFLEGTEASFIVFTDGKTVLPAVLAQDHKAAYDGDRGPNTGGMGAYSIDTILSNEQYDAVLNRIIRPTLTAAKSYSGVLYAGLMLTGEGPKLLEYNARFGDPETQVILSRLKTDLLDVLVDIAEHGLSSRTLEWSQEVTVTVVLVSRGYPGKIETGKEIVGLDEAKRIEGVKVYHAGTRWVDGKVYSAGGRVLNVTARGATLAEAVERAYFVTEMIEFDGKDYRKDIGKKGLLKQR